MEMLDVTKPNAVYDHMVRTTIGGLEKAAQALTPLLADDAAELRGKLLDRNEAATFEELLVGRMMFDLPGDVVTRVLSWKETGGWIEGRGKELERTKAIQLLRKSLYIALGSQRYSDEDLRFFGLHRDNRTRVVTGDDFPDCVLGAIHGNKQIRSSWRNSVSVSKICLLPIDYDKRTRVLDYIMKHRKKGKGARDVVQQKMLH